MKDEQNCSYNGGGDAYLLKIWSDFSSLPLFSCYVVLSFYTIDPIWGVITGRQIEISTHFLTLYDSIVFVKHMLLCHLLWYCMRFHLIRR